MGPFKIVKALQQAMRFMQLALTQFVWWAPCGFDYSYSSIKMACCLPIRQVTLPSPGLELNGTGNFAPMAKAIRSIGRLGPAKLRSVA